MLAHETRNILKDRSITTRYTLTDEGLAQKSPYPDEADSRPALDIITSHDKDGKKLRTSIHRVRVGGIIVTWVMDLRGEDDCPVSPNLGVPIARYSEKALYARHEEILAQINALPELERAELFEWASRAKGR